MVFVSSCGMLGEQCGTRIDFSPLIRIFAVKNNYTNALYSSVIPGWWNRPFDDLAVKEFSLTSYQK
jgi:hypothetical protein